jgi:hyaluronan synthase
MEQGKGLCGLAGWREFGRGGVAIMAPILLWLIMVLCLLISVAKYLMGIILKLAFPSAKIKKDYTYQPTVSVLMPCYNEGKTVYETIESISKSNYPIEKFEVIAQDDYSVDDSYEWILKAQRDFTNIRVRAGRNEANCGKARTVCNALQHSSADVIISIDSDCIFHPDAIRELTACFSEPRIGSVGGRVGVRNPNDGIITSIQAIVLLLRVSAL